MHGNDTSIHTPDSSLPDPSWVDTSVLENVYHSLAPQCEIALAEMGRILSETVEKSVPAV